ncbi:MAG: hypothetical protein AB7S38_36580 [Vulcanimicrobiota bacterium]
MPFNRRAFSLLELVVYASLLLLLLGGVTMVVVGGVRYLQTGSAYQTAQNESLIAMRKLVEDLGRSTAQFRRPASPLSDSDHIIFLSPEPPAGGSDWTYNNDELQYHFWICYYWDMGQRELVRARLPVGGTPITRSTIPVPTAPPLANFRPPANNDVRVIARGITDFAINDGATAQQLAVRLSSSVATASDKQTTVTTRSLIRMPNP